MDTSKVSLGEMIAGISALALFIFMFLPWYGVESVGGVGVGGFGVDTNVNAWESFSFIDILLLIAVIAVVGLVLARAADATPDLPQSPATIVAIAGGVALVLILFRLIFTPGVDTGGFEVDVDLGRKIGIFLGLIAAAGITYGGWRAMNEAVPAAGPRSRDDAATPAVATQTTSAPATPPETRAEPAAPPAAPPTPSSAPPPSGTTPPSAAPPGEGQPPAGGQPQQQ